jgi:hypothetical protein
MKSFLNSVETTKLTIVLFEKVHRADFSIDWFRLALGEIIASRPREKGPGSISDSRFDDAPARTGGGGLKS